MADFVLVHGAWHGGWCWEDVASRLESRGYTVACPDLPSDEPTLGVAAYAAALEGRPASIVVGHSLAGMTIPLVPARCHVFVAAFVPTPGEPLPTEGLDPAFSGTRRDEQERSYWPDAETAVAVLYPELDRTAAVAAFARLRPQGRLPNIEPSPVRELPRAAAYVLCTRDRVIRPAWQREAARRLLGVEPVEVDSGHFPMLERPRVLGDLLESLAG